MAGDQTREAERVPGAGGPPLLRARGLWRYFAGRPVLAGIDIELRAGERLGIFGANGSGKTTLLRLLAATLQPSRGEVELFGAPPGRARGRQRRQLGYLPEQAPVDENLEVQEYLESWLALQGVARHRRRELARQGAVALGVEKLLARRCAALSRGQRRLVSLARTLAHRPRLLLLDEPAAGLDDDSTARLESCLLAEPSPALVAASHRPRLLARLCRRVLVLCRGRARLLEIGGGDDAEQARLLRRAAGDTEFSS